MRTNQSKYGFFHRIYEREYNRKGYSYSNDIAVLEYIKDISSYNYVKRHISYALSGNCVPVNSPFGIHNAASETKALAIILYHRKVKK